jgi:hypothetical protein
MKYKKGDTVLFLQKWEGDPNSPTHITKYKVLSVWDYIPHTSAEQNYNLEDLQSKSWISYPCDFFDSHSCLESEFKGGK